MDYLGKMSNVNREANIVQAVIKTRVKDQNKGQSVSR